MLFLFSLGLFLIPFFAIVASEEASMKVSTVDIIQELFSQLQFSSQSSQAAQYPGSKPINEEIAFVESILHEAIRFPSFVYMGSEARALTTIVLTLASLHLKEGKNKLNLVETGVFRGASAALMIHAWNRHRARVSTNTTSIQYFYGFDSFVGLPPSHQQDGDGRYGNKGQQGSFAVTYEAFKGNMQRWNVWNDDVVRIGKGFFNETLPTSPVNNIAFLRLDGDLYVSTMDALVNLYHRVVPGGYIYVDDYGSFHGCRNAINEFREKNHIYETIHHVREVGYPFSISFESVWWQKRERKQRTKKNQNQNQQVKHTMEP